MLNISILRYKCVSMNNILYIYIIIDTCVYTYIHTNLHAIYFAQYLRLATICLPFHRPTAGFSSHDDPRWSKRHPLPSKSLTPFRWPATRNSHGV